MQKWEYMYVLCLRNEADEWTPKYINGKEVPNWFAGASIYQASNDLGEKGWELVSHAFVASPFPVAPDRDSIRLVFKRPK